MASSLVFYIPQDSCSFFLSYDNLVLLGEARPRLRSLILSLLSSISQILLNAANLKPADLY